MERITRLLDDAVGTVFPSAQVVVVDDGRELLAHAVGTTLEQPFDLASLTKPLCTAALVLRRVRTGALTLSDRPRPEATIAQLLSHASGVPAVLSLGDPLRPSPEMRRACIEHARTVALDYEPGTRSVYSDLGFILLGDAVERTGTPLDRAFTEEIACGADIAFGPNPAAAPTEGPRGVVHDDNAKAMQGVAGHAGLFGDVRSVSTLVRAWVDAWHGDDALLDPALVRLAWERAGVPGSTWGLGWDHPSESHSSAGTAWPRTGVGHLAFTGCSVWIDPPQRRWVVLLSNRVHPTRANERIRQFRPMLHDAVLDAMR
ncbi:MAG: serine hydrolase domain-containing protein [Polyangia bacterium]